MRGLGSSPGRGVGKEVCRRGSQSPLGNGQDRSEVRVLESGSGKGRVVVGSSGRCQNRKSVHRK